MLLFFFAYTVFSLDIITYLLRRNNSDNGSVQNGCLRYAQEMCYELRYCTIHLSTSLFAWFKMLSIICKECLMRSAVRGLPINVVHLRFFIKVISVNQSIIEHDSKAQYTSCLALCCCCKVLAVQPVLEFITLCSKQPSMKCQVCNRTLPVIKSFVQHVLAWADILYWNSFICTPLVLYALHIVEVFWNMY